MAVPYIDTPRTEIDGNATYLTNGLRSATRHNLSALSVEESFQSPERDRNLLKEFQNARSQKPGGASFRTPRATTTGSRTARRTLQDRPNAPAAAATTRRTEFTPLLKSVTKSNALRTADNRAAHGQTPLLSRNRLSDQKTPGLPSIDETGMYDESSMDHPTPVPHATNSSVQSSPLPILPGRGGNGIVGDGQNMMTLREQENMINKLDKENFGLKLKIHFLEQALMQRGPEFNRVALSENTELKVTTATMQRDIHRYKKSLLRAEREIDSCQSELEQLRQQSRSRGADDALSKQMESIREELRTKDAKIYALEDELKAARSNESDEISRLREEVDSLEFTIREKDRLLDDKDEEIENLKDKGTEENGEVAELEDELERAKAQLEDIQDSLEQARAEAEEAKASCEEAVAGKEQAVEDLRELQDEMANKSFTTKGLSRQMEERSGKLEEELADLQEQFDILQENLEAKTEEEHRLRQKVNDLQQRLSSEKEALQGEVQLVRHERNVAKRDYESLLTRLEAAEDELQARGDSKSILQNRHDALTDESKSLQRELERARASIADIEQQAASERQQLQTCHRSEIDRLSDEIAALRREFDDKESRFAADRDEWDKSKRAWELQKDQGEYQLAAYKRTVERLQSTESNLSGKESKLQQMLESEKVRFSQEEELLKRQISELNDDISSRREASEKQRLELLSAKDELRISKRELDSLKEKVQSLEDEVVVLQASLEEQQEYAKGQRKLGSSDVEKQLQSITREKQALRDQLASADAELKNLRLAVSDMEAERDELVSRLSQFENQVDDTCRLDQEKLGLRKAKLKLESEVNRLKEEKKLLVETKDALQTDLNAEIDRATTEENRLSAEVSRLQKQLSLRPDKRDGQLLSAKRTIERLEHQIKELENLIESQTTFDKEVSAKSGDLSLLRQSLELSRKKEKIHQQRETELKATVKELKSQIANLEKENYEVQAKRFDSVSPKSSVSSKLEQEIRTLREQLLEAHKTMKSLRAKNHELQRSLVDDNERRDLHELLKSSAIEAESLSLKLSEREGRINQLRSHLRRVREERALSTKRADAANRELEALQDQHEAVLDSLGCRNDPKGRHEKEIKGLAKEIMWLRARLRREEKFREDLAWSKGLMELGERVRVACNETDLQMIAEMGVETPIPETKLGPRRRFRAAAFAVVAATRMQNLAADWNKAKKVGEVLRRARSEVLKRRESAKRLG